MNSKLCLIYNTSPSYRESIFKLIDETYDCDWYFSNKNNGVKQMDKNKLKNVYTYQMFDIKGKLIWKNSVIKLLFDKRYQQFFTLAESRCVSDWIFLWLASHFFKEKKIYIWSHGWYGKETKIEAKIKKWMFKQAHGVFVYGEYARQLMIKEGLDGDKLFVIHNSLAYEQQLNLRQAITPSQLYINHFGNINPVLIMIGRIDVRKKLSMLIEAVAELKKKNEHYNIVLIGDGEDRPRLEKQVEELGMKDNVWFYGACFDEIKNAELMYNADMCIVPGHLGLTAIHAMMFGCPVITHNNFPHQAPEFEAIKEGITGSFFSDGDVRDLTNKISHWFESNRKNRTAVRDNCYKEIDNSWNPQFQINLIKSIIK